MGTVESTNLDATIQPRHLEMGGTSKDGDKRQAGVHGEGLKLALLIFQRRPQNHAVRCISGGFTWNFNFTNRGKLVARLRRMTAEQVKRASASGSKAFTEGLAAFAASPTRDVQFSIGQKSSGRNDIGDKMRRSQVSLEQFNEWCKVAIFLQNVTSEANGDPVKVGSKKGDLLMHPALRGNLYLKGLLLNASNGAHSASMTGQPLKFGYNFKEGSVNRERQSMASSRVEGLQILAIWDKVLPLRPPLRSELSDLLNSVEPKYADVILANEGLKEQTAILLKDHLFKDKSKWYFSATEKEKVSSPETLIHENPNSRM